MKKAGFGTQHTVQLHAAGCMVNGGLAGLQRQPQGNGAQDGGPPDRCINH